MANFLLTCVEGFLQQHQMLPSRFGQLALRDPSFVFELREGRDVRSSTAERLNAWMAAYRPDAPPPPVAQARAQQAR